MSRFIGQTFFTFKISCMIGISPNPLNEEINTIQSIMLSLKDFKSFEVNIKTLVGGAATPTSHSSGASDSIEDDQMYAGGSLLGCLCPGGSTGTGSDTYSVHCC